MGPEYNPNSTPFFLMILTLGVDSYHFLNLASFVYKRPLEFRLKVLIVLQTILAFTTQSQTTMQLFKSLAISLGLLIACVSALPSEFWIDSSLTRRQTCAGGTCNPEVGCGTECDCSSSGVSDSCTYYDAFH